MKQTKLNTKVNKAAKEHDSVNATLLQKGGFIHQTMTGVYSFLPLGLRVLNKIEEIVREEMDKIATELVMPALAPKEVWEKTGRINTVDVLFEASAANAFSKAKSSNSYILNSTHEEIITPIAMLFNASYKDFPLAFYQIQSKFRNEPRAKSGLLRGREFRMKDLYSFHTSEEDLLDYYHNQAKPAYVRVFERLGLGDDTVIALASGGDFTKEFSHEFQTKCETGEDLIFYDEVDDVYYNKEVTPSLAPESKLDQTEQLPMEDVYGEHITGMEELTKFLKVSADRCVKTLIYQADDQVVVVAVRGDYDVDELKLNKILAVKDLALASEETVKRITGAEIGYAGIINLPNDVRKIFDNSIENLVNFECGTNKTNYHSINVNWGRDLEKPAEFYDVKVAKEGDLNPKSGKPYATFKASEVGNIFPLNTKFSQAFDYKYTDQNGEQKYVYMGCYGIGPSRLMGLIVEKFHDEKGIIWPETVAPFQVHLLGFNLEDENVARQANEIYQQLKENNIEVLFDDRIDSSAGEKLADADIIGIPYRVIISKRTEGKLEVKKRDSNDATLISLEELVSKLRS